MAKAKQNTKTGKFDIQFWIKEWDGTYKKKTKRGFTTKAAAEKYAREQQEKNSGGPSMTIRDLWEVYEADNKTKLKPKTLYNRGKNVQKHILPYFGERKADEITSYHIMKWQEEIKRLNLAPETLKNIDKDFSVLFTHAVKYYGLKESPYAKAGRMTSSGPLKSKKPSFWTLEQYKTFIATIKPGKYHLLYDILFFTGIRLGECLALTPDDFDFNTNTLTISKTIFREHSKDIITTPKTERANRDIAVPQRVIDELNEYIKTENLSDKQRLFTQSDRAVQKVFRRAIEKTDLPRITPHDLRHSHVSLLIELGYDIKVIQERAGHSKYHITMDVYGHLYPSKQKEVATALDKI